MRPLFAALLVVVCVAVIWSPRSVGQDLTEERLNNLETRVAELEAVVYGASPPSVVAQATAAVSTGSQQTIGGTALDLLPQGEAGTVALIATGPLQYSQIPVIVRNNTEAPVADVAV